MVDWASPLLQRISERGGVTSDNMPLLFEARFAYELFRRGLRVQYEYPAGVEDSTIEFRIEDSREWLVELVSIRKSEGVRKATKKDGDSFHMVLSSLNLKKGTRDETKQSEEAEMITAQHKIGEKVLAGIRPTKFPCPRSSMHAILVGMRGYIGAGGDWIDYRQIAYGPDGVPANRQALIHYWEERPIRGLFEKIKNHPARAAGLLQERIHLLGFVAEKDCAENENANRAYWLPNPHLVTAVMQVEIQKTFPPCERYTYHPHSPDGPKRCFWLHSRLRHSGRSCCRALAQ
ncbi:MAG TPA: hypothetical protein PLC86_17835 [Candidatus Accumulibacter phosphatis]|nr:hypothetical protein [Candidatus Accumulibacter phosphatis]